jgi:hypothetical protein
MKKRFRLERANADGWTDWIHPLPGYQIKCCGCGLVHRLELRIDDAGQPNLRMGRTDDHTRKWIEAEPAVRALLHRRELKTDGPE